MGTNHSIVFLKNQFLYNVGVKGIVYIDSWSRQKPVIFYGNVFQHNAAYFGASALFIRARTDFDGSPAQKIPVEEADLECGGYVFQRNSFDYNYVCPVYGGGIFEFECIGRDAFISLNDSHFFHTIPTYPTDEPTLEFLK